MTEALEERRRGLQERCEAGDAELAAKKEQLEVSGVLNAGDATKKEQLEVRGKLLRWLDAVSERAEWACVIECSSGLWPTMSTSQTLC